MSTPLTAEERHALEIMRGIVAEKGRDYVYPEGERRLGAGFGHQMCQYATYDIGGYPTGPSCIVGHYLSARGVSAIELSTIEWSPANYAVARFVGDEGRFAKGRLAKALRTAQSVQDTRGTWGAALDNFEAVLFGLSDKEREVLTSIRDAVAEKGEDYLYPDAEKWGGDCQYAKYVDSKGEPVVQEDYEVPGAPFPILRIPVGPSCIVGHCAVRMGTPLEDLPSREGNDAIVFFSEDTAVAIEPRPRWVRALHTAQCQQDGGATWGVALRAFEDELGLSA